MADFVDILKEQVEEGRKTAPSSRHDKNRNMIQKKKLIPLEEPETSEMEIQVESKIVSENTKYADQGISHEENENEVIDEPETPPHGGALWNPPQEFERIHESMKEIPKHDAKTKKPSLFDLVMEPPKKELEPTLFTYFDKLMQMGEV